jgi:arylmalonate decarboxylase
MPTRRTVLTGSLAAASLAAIRLAHASDQPALGLIVPPALPWEPVEGLEMYAGQVRFLAEGLGLTRLSPEGYDSVVDLIAPLAERLAERGAEGIVLMGTSLSFYQGVAFNQRLTDSMEAASGLPSITMSTAVISGLREMGATRIAAATAYTDVVNDRLARFLADSGFEVAAMRGLDIEDISKVESVTGDTLVRFGAEVAKEAEVAEALLLSCGGLRTLEVLAPLEAAGGLPVVSSTPHAYWAGMRLIGLDGRAPGYGALLAG